ncbi:hypothetical protein [Streptomyces sp. NBC_01217]|uniref:hypothetical protein n=1 Tax=Streptomyces sp. NBC_01217 TaxID=2903779 RepID=UPI002E11C566|nr:hypothetical protein OG507_20790 [Streptomyces sp. NBC_01217]
MESVYQGNASQNNDGQITATPLGEQVIQPDQEQPETLTRLIGNAEIDPLGSSVSDLPQAEPAPTATVGHDQQLGPRRNDHQATNHAAIEASKADAAGAVTKDAGWM